MKSTVKNENEIKAIAASYSKAAGIEVEESKKEILTNAVMIKIATIKVTSQETMKGALELLAALKSYLKEKDDRRKSIVDPINQSVKLINQDYKKITDKVNEAIETVTSEIMKYRQIEAKRIAEANAKEMARIAKEAAELEAKTKKELKGTKGDARQEIIERTQETIQELADNAKIKTQVKTIENTGITFKKYWTYRLIDVRQVPRQYLELNLASVNQAVRDGVRDIPGINIFEKETTARN